MSKSQHGNKEAKKPKQVKPQVNPLAPNAAVPSLTPNTPDRAKKKK